MIKESLVYRSLLRHYRKELVLFLLLSVVLTSLQAPIPYLTGFLIDNVLPSGSHRYLLQTASLLLALFVGQLIVEYLNSRLKLAVRRDALTALSGSAIRDLLGLSRNQRLRLHNGDLLSRLTRDAVQLEAVMPYGWSELLHKLLLSLTLLAVIFVLNWQLTLLVLFIIPVAILLYLRFDEALWRTSEAETQASAKRLAIIQETIEGDDEIKAYAAEAHFVEHCRNAVADFENKSFARSLYDTKVGLIISGMPMLAVVMIWYLGGYKAMAGEISIGLIITYTSTLTMMVPALIGIVEFVSALPNELTALRRLTELHEQSAPLSTPVAQTGLTTLSPAAIDSLSMHLVNFSYQPAYPIFRKLSIRFEAGQAYLINGGNGAGKSTLLGLLSGGLHPSLGTIRLNGSNIADNAARSKLITYVPQRVHIFSDTVRQNITLGESCDDDTLKSLLQQVGLGSWLARLERGLDHRLGIAANELSGGQAQKLAIARALLRDTPVLLLDEPTNNLDSQAVNLLIERIRQHRNNRIIIMVSHDDRVFDVVDKLVYLENNDSGSSTRVSVTDNPHRKPAGPASRAANG